MTAQHAACLGDILWGFEHYPELRPNPERIDAMKALPQHPAIKEMVAIWESGHGVLTTKARLEAFANAMLEVIA